MLVVYIRLADGDNVKTNGGMDYYYNDDDDDDDDD